MEVSDPTLREELALVHPGELALGWVARKCRSGLVQMAIGRTGGVGIV